MIENAQAYRWQRFKSVELISSANIMFTVLVLKDRLIIPGSMHLRSPDMMEITSNASQHYFFIKKNIPFFNEIKLHSKLF